MLLRGVGSGAQKIVRPRAFFRLILSGRHGTNPSVRFGFWGFVSTACARGLPRALCFSGTSGFEFSRWNLWFAFSFSTMATETVVLSRIFSRCARELLWSHCYCRACWSWKRRATVRITARDRAHRAGRNIRRFREAKGLSQEALATSLGFALGTSVSSLERGKTTLSLEVALMVCDVLEISLNELVETEDDSVL